MLVSLQVEHVDDDKPRTLDCGLERRAVRIPTFAKLYIGTAGFIFIFCSCVTYRCVRIIPTCFISSCLLYFGIATLQMALNAQGWGGGVAPWRAILKDSARYGKEVHRKFHVALLTRAQPALCEKTKYLESGKLGNDLAYFSTYSGEQ